MKVLFDSHSAQEACTLPTADQPLRVAEFETLFTSNLREIRRLSPTSLALVIDGDPAVEHAARDLAARESQCCSFFTFTFDAARSDHDDDAAVEMGIAVPGNRSDVLDGIERMAASSMRHEGRS